MQITLTPDDVRDDDRPRRRLFVRWTLGIAFVLFLVGALFTLVTLIGVRADLERGRQALDGAHRALIKGDLDRSHDLLLQAREAFGGARDETSGLVAGVARWTPLLGRNVVVVRGLADAGAALSRAGLSLIGGIQDLPGGVDALAPQTGRLPLEALSALTGPAETSATEGRTALTAIEQAPSTLLLSPVAQARWDAAAQVRDAADAFTTARDLLVSLPSFAGVEVDRRYLFFAQNPAELRSGGGLWGAYSILTIHDGRLQFSQFRSITTLRELPPDEVPPPSPDFRRNYDQYGGAGKWRNMNVTPDFPTASRAALSSWLVLHGEMLDGVIAADPFALRSILRVTGPTTVASLDRVIGPGNVVSYVTNEAYGRFDDAASRKEVIGQAAEAALAQLFTMHGHGLARLRAIADAAGAGHLKVYVTDERMQQALEQTAAGGAMEAIPRGDLLAVYVNNGSESKIDFYVRRTVSYGVRLGGNLEAFGTTAVTLENDAPTEGRPSVVIGPNGDQAEEPGDEVHVLSTWCPAACPLVSAKRDGEEILVRQGLEAGRRFYYDFSRLPANSSTTFITTTKRDGVWEGDLSSGSYRLTILPQTTIIPTTIRVRIQAPDGTHIVWANEPMAVADGVAVWSGTPESPVILEVRFQASPPLRWLRNVTELLR